MTKYAKTLAVVAAMVWPFAAQSHTAWFVPSESMRAVHKHFRVVFGGHNGELDYPPEKVKSISAIGEDAAPLPFWRTTQDGVVLIRVDESPAMLLMHFDNGIYTRTTDGRSIHRPMSQVEGSVSAINALKYHKYINTWTDVVSRPQGQPFEVVPVDAAPPEAGTPMQVRVLIDGQPVEGVGVGTGETSIQSQTGPDGVATFTPAPGHNTLWAGQRTAVSDDPDFTQLSIEYLMTFHAAP